MGLFLREAHELLRQIQTLVLNEQAAEFARVAAGCLACGRRLGIKDTKPLVYRTAFGKAVLRSPRFYSHCSGCGLRFGEGDTVSPLDLMQNWFALSDPAMEEALYEIASLRAFAHLSLGEPIPDETTILNFRHLLEASDMAEDILTAVNKHLQRKGLLLKRGSIVDATIIAAPSSTKNADGERDPEMHQTKKGNQ
jgi:IS5 family transposase